MATLFCGRKTSSETPRGLIPSSGWIMFLRSMTLTESAKRSHLCAWAAPGERLLRPQSGTRRDLARVALGITASGSFLGSLGASAGVASVRSRAESRWPRGLTSSRSALVLNLR